MAKSGRPMEVLNRTLEEAVGVYLPTDERRKPKQAPRKKEKGGKK